MGYSGNRKNIINEIQEIDRVQISRKLALKRCINLTEDAIHYRVAQCKRAVGGKQEIYLEWPM